MSELDRLYRQKNSYNYQKSQYMSERAAVSEKIRRLKETKRAVDRIKDYAGDARNYISGKMETHKDTWAGDEQRKVEEMHASGINAGFSAYYNDVDKVLDSICDEITRLENENRNLGFLLNTIINKINDISNEIEKWMN